MQLLLAGDPNRHEPPLRPEQQVYVNWDLPGTLGSRGRYMTKLTALMYVVNYLFRGKLPPDYMRELEF